MVLTIIKISFYVIGLYLILYSAHWLFTSIVASFNKKKLDTFSSLTKKKIEQYLILIPAYRPQWQLIEVLESLKITKKYKKQKVYILFQNADPLLIHIIRNRFKCIIDEKSFESLKGNSYHHALRYALKRITQFKNEGLIKTSHILLLDKNNILKKNFIEKIIPFIENEYDIIQGKRLPLNSKIVTENYDSIAESLNDSMFRKAKYNLGLIPEITGSGTFYTFESFSYIINRLDYKVPRFDKFLMILLLTSIKKLALLISLKLQFMKKKQPHLRS